MGSKHITPKQKQTFIQALADGYTIKDAAGRAGTSEAWGRKFAPKVRPRIASKPSTQDVHPDAPLRPLHRAELTPISRDCLEDFARFRARFFGRISSPWQEHAAYTVRDHLQTPDKEFGVINVAPGTGKSTLFTHDIPAWLICRSRSIREFIGSSTQTTANSYTGRLRNSFERPTPYQAQSEEIALGLSRDADSTLINDYGLFKPPPDLGAPWSRSQFTVQQVGETRIGEKEATVTAFGEDTKFLGWRVNFIVWDDLVTASSVRTEDAINNQRAWWINEAQTRLEPGGLLILQGQRLHPEDLYRFCLDMNSGYDLLDDHLIELGIEELPRTRKYFHIVYKAHYEELCRAKEDPTVHRMTSSPYNPSFIATPDHPYNGCLIDPVRLPYRELMAAKNQPLTNFEVVYQQEDISPSEVLVPKIYIDGGTDPETGIEYVGCWDPDRDIGEIPRTTGTTLSVLTVDPSPSKFWAVQWWLYNEPPRKTRLKGDRYLLDLKQTPMGANDLLDFNVAQNTWTGLLEDWHSRSILLHRPITHIIVEINAAQKFLLQYDWFKDWTRTRSVVMRPHTTGANKADAKFGVGILRAEYQFGRVRLPGTQAARRAIQPLINEVTRWPNSSTDDEVMAQWFLEHNLQHLVRDTTEHPSLYNDIPSWMNREATFA